MTTQSVLHLATNDWGGAGKAAVRIHESLLSQGIDSALLVKSKKSNDVDRVFDLKSPPLLNKIRRLIDVVIRRMQFSEKYAMYSIADSGINGIANAISTVNIKPDVIILHWVSGFISLGNIVQLKKYFDCDIYLYAMDMAPFTGGCHYSWGCNGYKSDCAQCPAKFLPVGGSSPESFFRLKKEIVKDNKVGIIAPNKWVEKQIEQSGVLFKSVDVCYLPIDSNVFLPEYDPKEQECTGIIKIFFGSLNIGDLRKGGRYFIEALTQLDKMLDASLGSCPLPVIILPGVEATEIDDEIPFEIKRIKYAENEKELSAMYQSSDLFVCTSIEDSGPMMVCESLMSGVPVIGFKMGVLPELIENGENGYLVELMDSNALAQSIFDFLHKDVVFRTKLKQNSRKSVEKIMSFESHTKKLLEIISR